MVERWNSCKKKSSAVKSARNFLRVEGGLLILHKAPMLSRHTYVHVKGLLLLSSVRSVSVQRSPCAQKHLYTV
jgi:hypothetical protein